MGENKGNRTVAIGLMLFALFFGAGNLIFPAAWVRPQASTSGGLSWASSSPVSACRSRVSWPWVTRAVRTCRNWLAAFIRHTASSLRSSAI